MGRNGWCEKGYNEKKSDSKFSSWRDCARTSFTLLLELGLQSKSPMKWDIIYGTQVPAPRDGSFCTVSGATKLVKLLRI